MKKNNMKGTIVRFTILKIATAKNVTSTPPLPPLLDKESHSAQYHLWLNKQLAWFQPDTIISKSLSQIPVPLSEMGENLPLISLPHGRIAFKEPAAAKQQREKKNLFLFLRW